MLEIIAGHALKPMPERVAWAITRLDAKAPGAALRITRGDLASLAGTTLESTIRCLSKWKKEGILETTSKTVRVLKPREIRRLAGEPLGLNPFPKLRFHR